MIRRFLVLGFIALLSVGVSFADFQSELNECKYNESCRTKVARKYVVSKTAACKMKDGEYKKPLQISRPNMKINNESFQKKENFLFYTFDLYTGTYEQYVSLSDFGPTNQRFFSYDCATKKTFNITEKVKNNKNNKVTLGYYRDILQSTDKYIFMLGYYYESSQYLFLNLKTGKLDSATDILSLSKGIDGVKKKYEDVLQTNFPHGIYMDGDSDYNGTTIRIKDVSKKFIVDFSIILTNGDEPSILIPSIKLDLINKKIVSY